MSSSNASLSQVASLLKQVTSMDVVKDFLKNKGLAHSAGSWDVLINTRLQQALDAKAISIDELVQLLRDCEESGKQHIFLFSCSPKSMGTLLDENRITRAIEKKHLQHLLEGPVIIDTPDEPTVCDIRWEEYQGGKKALVIKVLDSRRKKEKSSEMEDGDVLTVSYKIVTQRVIKLAKLHSDGLLELRVTSQSNGSKYNRDISSLRALLNPFLEGVEFIPVSLAKAKDKIWNDRDDLKDTIQHTHSIMKNDYGTTLQAAASTPENDLMEDAAATGSLELFLDNDGYCDTTNIWFIGQSNGIPSKRVHTLISGELNEFAVPAHCKKQDYDYVLGKIRSYNK